MATEKKSALRAKKTCCVKMMKKQYLIQISIIIVPPRGEDSIRICRSNNVGTACDRISTMGWRFFKRRTALYNKLTIRVDSHSNVTFNGQKPRKHATEYKSTAQWDLDTNSTLNNLMLTLMFHRNDKHSIK